ncbi:uncharacterized protein SCHCODRAFT_02635863 [Schizophyllum commune H4-8]|uniref:Expressed protein n=1 Tax=Schizophyllum commune (strain H4-8 / FGSC 9210) TaxID=578458 RepID=D8QET8_SCHCM|nr:uncharacterized protein SCHCODRAFT_02635863 [Schizophyllum commune H4-8]KAI5888147.1 hypothetical protein SCHCODRAFT_02635863 [Schizophyllum commune H4-8]
MQTPSRYRGLPGALDASLYDFETSPPRSFESPSSSSPSRNSKTHEKGASFAPRNPGPSIFEPQPKAPKPSFPRAPRTGLGYLAELADALPTIEPPSDSTSFSNPLDTYLDFGARPTRGLPRQFPSEKRFPHVQAQAAKFPPSTPSPPPLSPQVAALREREASEAARGEEEWVLAGGTLRDAHGRRDPARTAAVRRQALRRIRMEERERVKRGRWAAYEAQWGVVARMPVGVVRFADVPWPVFGVEEEGEEDEEDDDGEGGSAPVMPGLFGARSSGEAEGWGGRAIRPEDVTEAAVEKFMRTAAGYSNPTDTGCSSQRHPTQSGSGQSSPTDKHALRDRVRRGLLRWHPDKLVAVLRRVAQEDTEDVERAARVVFSSLQGMNGRIGSE